MAKLSEWQPYSRYVQGGMVDGQFMSAAFTLVAAGPPRLANIGGATGIAAALSASGSGKDFAMPIGVVQNINLSHNRSFARFWEVGSERSYFISFWMKNTLISLDMIFFNDNFVVTGVVHRAKPRDESAYHVGQVNSRYVLEVPAGFARRAGITSGTSVAFSLP